MKTIHKILKLLQGHGLSVFLNILFNAFSVFFSLVSFASIIPFLNLLFQSNPELPSEKVSFSLSNISAWFEYEVILFITSFDSKIQALLYVAMGIIVVFLLKNIFRYLALFVLAKTRHGIVRTLREKIYSNILVLPIGYFSEKRKGDILTRCSSDLQEVEWGILMFLEMMFKEPITFIIYIVALFSISPKLTLFILVLMPLSGGIIGFIGRKLRRVGALAQEKLGMVLSIIEESINGQKIIKSFSAHDQFNDRFKKENTDYFRLMVNMMRKRDMAAPLSEFLSITTVVIVMYVGGKIVIQEQTLSAESFILYMIILSQIILPIKAFSTAWYNIQKGMASLSRVEEITNATPENDTDKNKDFKFKKEIELKIVSFSYDSKPVLKQIQLKVEKGKSIALVGASGAGKSTIADLIPGFYDVQHGEIAFDGIPIEQISKSALRDEIAVVTQHAILFHDTIRNNVTLGKEYSDEAVIKALKAAHAWHFVEHSKQGLQSMIGDQGSNLSGGERQRLTIARAILKNAPILILDEATSALDAESEHLVQEALKVLMKGKTSIVIAHRLATIQHVDEICVMHEGAIVERGTHATLVQNEGAYKKLVDLQLL